MARSSSITSRLDENGVWHAHYVGALRTLCLDVELPDPLPPTIGRRWAPTCPGCIRAIHALAPVVKGDIPAWMLEQIWQRAA